MLEFNKTRGFSPTTRRIVLLLVGLVVGSLLMFPPRAMVAIGAALLFLGLVEFEFELEHSLTREGVIRKRIDKAAIFVGVCVVVLIAYLFGL